MQIRTVRSDDGMELRTVTLASVADSPHAFGGSTQLAEEQAHPAAYWHTFAAESAGDVAAWRDRCVAYLATDGEVTCGKLIAYLAVPDARRAYLSGVWVAPGYRRRGLGRQLVNQGRTWAVTRGASHLALWVNDANPDAVIFYEALGFRYTGRGRSIREGSDEQEREFEIALPSADRV